MSDDSLCLHLNHIHQNQCVRYIAHLRVVILGDYMNVEDRSQEQEMERKKDRNSKRLHARIIVN